jgi:glycosyltransferase involved in cell wall biosynthesis
LIVGGSESEIAGVRRKAERLGVTDACTFLTRQPEAVVEEYMALGDVLVSPREYGANLPLKIFHYIAAGRPIVATDIRCHRSVLDERMAVLTPVSESGLAEGICSVLDDPERGMALASAASSLTADQLSWAAFVKQVDQVMTMAIGSG